MSNPHDVESCPLPPRDEGDRARALLEGARVIAVVGMSPDPSRPAFEVGQYLRGAGYAILPVHPAATEIAGLAVYRDLEAIPRDVRVDIVDLFVAGHRTPPLVEQAARIGASAVWFQPGAENAAAAARARALGLEVVSGRCTMAEHIRMKRGMGFRV